MLEHVPATGKRREAFLDRRGMATHAALSLLADRAGQDFRGLNSNGLRRLMLHKATNFVRREDRQSPNLRKYQDVRQYIVRDGFEAHHGWVAKCCGHLSALLAGWEVTEIFAVEARLPPVRLGEQLCDTGEMDLVCYSNLIQGTLAIEMKTRVNRTDTWVRNKKAAANAVGLERWLEQHRLPELHDMLWVFFTPGEKYPQVPEMIIRDTGYQAATAWSRFDQTHAERGLLTA